MPQFMKVLYRVQIIKPNQVKCFGDQSTQGNHYQFRGEIQQTQTTCGLDSRTKLGQNDGRHSVNPAPPTLLPVFGNHDKILD